MTASPQPDLTHDLNVVFARAIRNSDQVILPVNNSARLGDTNVPAFYCIHSVSGAAGTDFLGLAKRLEPGIRFYGIQAPPKLIRNTSFGSSIESLAEHYANTLAAFQPEGPIMLGGYCVGAVIALEVAKRLREQGREIGPLIAIDGVPENSGTVIRRWTPHYLWRLARNFRGWIVHADLMRNRTVNSLMWSISNNAVAIGRGVVGLKRGEKWGGGHTIAGIMDVSRFHPAERSFIDRLFGALFAYKPQPYSDEVIVYEAGIAPLLYLPMIGRTWQRIAPKSEVIDIVGTHISIMREPYVSALALDLQQRIKAFFAARSTKPILTESPSLTESR